jgi:hypothetical protein
MPTWVSSLRALVLALLPVADALSGGSINSEDVVVDLFPRAEAGKGYLSVPVDTYERTEDHVSHANRRNALEAQLDNMNYFYAMTCKSPTSHPI